MKQLPLLAIVVFILSCQGTVIRVSRPHLGTTVNLTFVARQEAAQEIAGPVFGEIRRIERLMDPSSRASDPGKLNDQGWRGPVRVSEEIFVLIKKSARIAEETGSCYDPTVAPLVRLWEAKNKESVSPAPGEVAGLLPLVNHRNIRFFPEKKSIAFATQGMRIDMRLIERGYAVRRGLEILRKNGLDSAVVEAGGILQAMGSMNGKPWTASVKHPRNDSILLTIELENFDAASTLGGREQSLIIDPRTGFPTEAFSSVTVISKNASLSAGYANAIFVMGLGGVRKFLERHAEIAVILIDKKGGLYASKRLRDRITFTDQIKAEWL